jgi:hypothetical protein
MTPRPPGSIDSNPFRRRLRLIASTCACAITGLLLLGCGLRPAFSVKIAVADKTPRDASVFIDEEFIGMLGYVAAHGVRMPEGEHRLTVERDGYFPFDRILKSDGEPIVLQVQMTPLPD